MWETKRLGEICKTSSGGTPSRKNESYFEGNIPWVKSGELNFNTIRDTEEKITEQAISESSAKIFPKGTLLIALYGATVGKLAFLGIEAATNQAVCSIIPKKNLSDKYLYWYLFSIKKDLVGKSIGGAQPNISQTILKDIEVPIPPLPTQLRIVEKIEELFSELDNGMENLKKAQQQLKTYRQAVLKDAFEGKLTKEWREQQTDLPTPEELLEQIKAERKAHHERELAEWGDEIKQWEKKGKPGRKPRKPSKLPRLEIEHISIVNDLPGEWLCIPLEQIGYWQGGGTPSKRKPEYWDNGGVLWVSPKDMKRKNIENTEDYITEEAVEDSSTKWVDKGSILFVVRSGILRRILPVAIAMKDLTVNQDIQALTPIVSVNSEFIYWYCYGYERTIRDECAKDGTTVESIDSSKLKAFGIPFCSVKEQDQIVQEIESRLSIVDQLEKTIEENLLKAEALRQSILKKAFSRELVKEQSKTDEVEITPFQQMQMIGVLVDILKEEYDMAYGEMALAKFLFLIDRIKKYRTGFHFRDWHWGPYDPEIKKRIFKKGGFFQLNEYSAIKLNEKRDQLFKYNVADRNTLETGVHEIGRIISKFKGKKGLQPSRQLELLATVAKVIENESSTDLEVVRVGMKNWKTPKTDFANKAEKFSEEETTKCLSFIKKQGWDELLKPQQ